MVKEAWEKSRKSGKLRVLRFVLVYVNQQKNIAFSISGVKGYSVILRTRVLMKLP